MAESGYTDCACRDCFDIAVSDDMDAPDLCGDCEDAGCDDTGESECSRDDAYGCDEEPAHDDAPTCPFGTECKDCADHRRRLDSGD